MEGNKIQNQTKDNQIIIIVLHKLETGASI